MLGAGERVRGLVPGVGVEPTRVLPRRILSPLRLPFRHPGLEHDDTRRPRTIHAMGRREERLFRLNDEIARLREEIRLTDEELRIHQHLDDDARRDAAVGGPIEREDARGTSADVARFAKLLDDLRGRVAHLEEKRDRLLSRLH